VCVCTCLRVQYSKSAYHSCVHSHHISLSLSPHHTTYTRTQEFEQYLLDSPLKRKRVKQHVLKSNLMMLEQFM
jgi:hypothetical protein